MRQELYQTIERNRQVVSQQLGQRLAEKYDVKYPSSLEATVLEGWQAFLTKTGENKRTPVEMHLSPPQKP